MAYGFPITLRMEESTFGPLLLSLLMLHWKSAQRQHTRDLMLFTSSSSQDFSPPPVFDCSINFQIVCSRSPLAHPFGLAICMNLFLLAFHFHSSSAIHGVFKECHCWWTWRGDCTKCLSPVMGMEGIFCSNFCKSRGTWGPCRMMWHANCYKCLGIGQFPLCLHQDIKGNLCFKQKAKENEINHGVRGAHATMLF
jgi:hypothetical protein